MSHIMKAICAILLLASLGLPQQNSTERLKPTGESDKAFDAIQQKAMSLLDQLFNNANSFEDDLLRIKIQTQIADLLWEYDEPRARRMFETSFQAIASTKLPAQDKSAPPSYVGADSRYPLRIDVINLISQRDTALAAKLIESVVDQPPNVDPKFLDSYGNYSESDMLRFQFALGIADSDPQRATRIARAFIQKGDTRRVISILEALRHEDYATANDLFAQAVSQVKQNKIIAPEDVRYFASYLFPDFGAGVISFTSNSDGSDDRKAVRASAALIPQFFDLAYKAVMQWTDAAPKNADGADSQANAQASFDYTIAELLLPYFDKYMPDKSASIRARVSKAGTEHRVTNNRSGKDKEIIGRGETTDLSGRDQFYTAALMQAMQSRDNDKAKAMLEKISDEQTRERAALILQHAEEINSYKAAHDAMSKGDMETAHRLISELPSLGMRISMLCSMSFSFFYRKDIARAVQTLDEAKRLCANGDDGIDKAQQMMLIAGVGARLDAARGFEDMKMVVEVINHAGFARQWQKTETITGEKNPVTIRKNVGLETLGVSAFDSGFSYLSRADFERALLLAKAIEMKEASALMQVSVCRGVLKQARQGQSQETAKPKLSGKPKQSN